MSISQVPNITTAVTTVEPIGTHRPRSQSLAERVTVHTDQLKRELATIGDVSDAVDLRCRLQALQSYAKSAQHSLDLQNEIAELKLRAERSAGRLLREMKLHGGDRKSGSKSPKPTLQQLGINKTQSHIWQYEALVDEDEFEAYCKSQRDQGKEITQSGLRRITSRKHRMEQQSGMRCPRCGLRANECVKTYAVHASIRRRDRKCLFCDLHWVTWEFSVDPSNPPHIPVYQIPRASEGPSIA